MMFRVTPANRRDPVREDYACQPITPWFARNRDNVFLLEGRP
jgi:hypothetical protein